MVSGHKTAHELDAQSLECGRDSRGVGPEDQMKGIHQYLDDKTKRLLKTGVRLRWHLITPDEIVLAVLGDSPIQVLMTDGTEFVMPEHNVRSNYQESQDAMSRGGVVVNGYLFKDYGDYAKGIQMSRTFGDVSLRSVTLQTPQTAVLKRADVSSLLVASDGLTDPAHMTASFLLTKGVTGPELAKKYKNSFDNVTAVVVHF